MSVDVRTHLDFFDFNGFLLLAGFSRFLCSLIFVAAVIKNFADGRFGVRCDLDKVQSGLIRPVQRILNGNCAYVLSAVVNELNCWYGDFLIDSRPLLGRLYRFIWAANDRSLLLLMIR